MLNKLKLITMDILDENNDNGGNSRISQITKDFLTKSSGWVKAVAIIGIVFSILGVLGGILTLIAIPIVGVIYLIIYGLAIYISLILLKVANSASAESFNLDVFAENFYKYWKIVVIMIIVGFALALIGGILMASMGVSLIGEGMRGF